MYYLKTEQSFDASHFLKGYEGVCKNLHGHRWRVIIKVQSVSLHTDQQVRGMIVDFTQLKKDLKEVTDYFDHSLIVEKNTMKGSTVQAMQEEGFRLAEVEFRPTAENFSRYFYDKLTDRGYQVKSAAVYETPTNCASYEEETDGTV